MPEDATRVVFHSAVLGDLGSGDERRAFPQIVRDLEVVRISNEPPVLFPEMTQARARFRSSIPHIVAVAMEARIQPGYTGLSRPVTGLEDLRYEQMGAITGAAIGKPVQFEEISEEEAKVQQLALSKSPPWVQARLSIFRAIRKVRLAKVTDTVEKVLNRSPWTSASERARTHGRSAEAARPQTERLRSRHAAWNQSRVIGGLSEKCNRREQESRRFRSRKFLRDSYCHKSMLVPIHSAVSEITLGGVKIDPDVTP
jgi:hypothetical protein